MYTLDYLVYTYDIYRSVSLYSNKILRSHFVLHWRRPKGIVLSVIETTVFHLYWWESTQAQKSSSISNMLEIKIYEVYSSMIGLPQALFRNRR